MTDTTPRRREVSHATETPPQHENAGHTMETTARQSSPARRRRDTERLLQRGEAALTETERAAAFRARGDLRALRRLADQSDDPAVRERATAVVDAFDRLRRAVWTARPNGSGSRRANEPP